MSTLPWTGHLNQIWSSLITAEFLKNGIDTFFISPGNRNAPLIAALAYENRAIKKICIDERAAGYRALGYAKATGRPGVLVCTSGTAPANYYPAVIEASREDIPMIILSADRPPELVGSDANQTIFQQDLYGNYCRKTLFLPCPDAAYPLEALLSKLNHVISHPEGPVHVNFPFRDPLTPEVSGHPPVAADLIEKASRLYEHFQPYTAYCRNNVCPDLSALVNAIQTASRGMIMIGRLDLPQDAPALAGLLQNIVWPVFCDIASSLKSVIPATRQIFSLDHPEAVRLINAYDPDIILQFGSGLVSKHYYASILPQSRATVIQVSPRSGLRDPAHRVHLRINAPIATVAVRLKSELSPVSSADSINHLMMQMDRLRRLVKSCMDLESLSFALIASTLLEEIPENDGLYLGNSIAIRAFDAVLPSVVRNIRVISNRGVSGIEGNIATSIGFAEGAGCPVTAVIGDLSFLHDLNSLLFLRESKAPVILVVVNNGGGRIFERLPMIRFPQILHPYMTAPHNLNFKMLAEQFELPYFRIDRPQELAEKYRLALQSKQSTLLEVLLSPENDLRIFQAMQQARLT